MKNRNKIITTILLMLGLLALPEGTQAVSPPPDGGYPGQNTAEGSSALLHLNGGTYNTAVGWSSLDFDVTGNFNTAMGAATLFANSGSENTAMGVGALLSNTMGEGNTANGAFALFSNTIGTENTASGLSALQNNTEGNDNTAIGRLALFTNNTGGSNTAVGESALFNNAQGGVNTAVGLDALLNNTTGDGNTATGVSALSSNTSASDNTATGHRALEFNTTGTGNTAVGTQTLSGNVTGSNNTAVGFQAGLNAGGSNNIYIGAGIVGLAGDDGACRIGSINGATITNGTAVFVNSDNRLGTVTSSKRFKQNITPTNSASEAIYELQPVRFQYRKEIDPDGRWQFGLVAEDVEKVNPDLVVRDKEGKPYSVRYDQVNAMLLNEFLKAHRKMGEQQSTIENQQAAIADLRSTVTLQQKNFEATIAQQQREIRMLTANFTQQAAQIQKVNAQIEKSKAGLAVVTNGRLRRDSRTTSQ